MTFKWKWCLLKEPLHQLRSAPAPRSCSSPADEVKPKLDSNMPKPHVIISFLQKVVISLNSVTRSSTCRLPAPHSAVCFHFSSCFVVFLGGDSCEEMRAIEGVYVPGSHRGFLMCNMGHFGIQVPGAIL